METIKILHSGDWHLSNRGNIAGRFILSQGMNQILLDRVLALKKIVEYVQENGIDLITIAGDIFDHHDPEDVAVDVAVSTIETLLEKAPVIIVKGNHEGGKGSEISNALASLKKRPGIYVFEEPGALPIPIKDRRVKVFALPYPRKPSPKSDPKLNGMSPEEISVFVSGKLEDVLTGFQMEFDPDTINILVGHFQVFGSSYGKDQQAPPFDISVRPKFLEPFDLVCLGHLHASQPFYSGAIARGGFGDEGIPVGFKIHTIDSKQNITTEFIDLPAREYKTLSVEDFLKNSNGVNPDVALRVKGKVAKIDYDQVIRKMKSLNLPFLKNSVEIEMETAGSNGNGDASEEPDVEAAIRMWGKGREGVDKFMDRLVVAGKEVEEKFNEARK